jgi:hypothetical protein
MRFAYLENYYEGPVYRFGDFETWLRRALGKRVKPSEHWTRTYGKDWTLVFALSAKRGRTRPKIFYGPDVNRREKTVAWGISVDYVGNKSHDPKSYVGPIRQFLEGIITVLEKLEMDTSKLSTELPAVIKEFCSNRYMIGEEATAENYVDNYVITPNTTVRHRRLPKWKIPKDLIKRVEEEGDWESDRFAPVHLLVMPGTGRKALDWQVELDIDLEDKQYANAAEKIKAMGNEPDGDGWTELVEREFTKRYPKLAREFSSDSEMATCVVLVKSETACKKLLEVIWSLIYSKRA